MTTDPKLTPLVTFFDDHSIQIAANVTVGDALEMAAALRQRAIDLPLGLALVVLAKTQKPVPTPTPELPDAPKT